VDDYFWFAGWLIAIAILFAFGLRAPALCLRLRSPLTRTLAAMSVGAGVVAVIILANVALTRHDAHFDLTRERVFTPDPDALEVVARLNRPVRLTYFYREDDPEGNRARHIVELMAHNSEFLQVQTL